MLVCLRAATEPDAAGSVARHAHVHVSDGDKTGASAVRTPDDRCARGPSRYGALSSRHRTYHHCHCLGHGLFKTLFWFSGHLSPFWFSLSMYSAPLIVRPSPGAGCARHLHSAPEGLYKPGPSPEITDGQQLCGGPERPRMGTVSIEVGKNIISCSIRPSESWPSLAMRGALQCAAPRRRRLPRGCPSARPR